MKKVIYAIMLFSLLITNIYARSGCCSYHGGVTNECRYGKQVCLDGTVSKTCTCETYENIQSSNSQINNQSQNYNERKNIYGCTDSNAKNYNNNATKDDGSCIYYKYGCTDINAYNYDETAEKDDGSCIEKKYGCMDKEALNYDESANINMDCIYEKQEEVVNQERFSKNENITQDNEEDTNVVPALLTIGLGIFGIKKLKKK